MVFSNLDEQLSVEHTSIDPANELIDRLSREQDEVIEQLDELLARIDHVLNATMAEIKSEAAGCFGYGAAASLESQDLAPVQFTPAMPIEMPIPATINSAISGRDSSVSDVVPWVNKAA